MALSDQIAAHGGEKALPADTVGAAARLIRNPGLLFAVLSIAFGTIIAFIDPPLRGHDESAHFLRVYGLARGELFAEADQDGRKGLFIPAPLHDDFVLFLDQVFAGKDVFDFRQAFATYEKRLRERDPAPRPPVFTHYGGSEGYAPVAYIPYLPAAAVADLLALDFVSSLRLMRLTGLVLLSLLTAGAIALTPQLKWAFFLVGMLPAALYGRSIVSADGGSLACAMIVAALCLRAAHEGAGSRVGERALWMLLCVLAKPPQIAFLLLEGMTRPLSQAARQWRSLAAIVVPGLVAAPIWVIAVGADVAAWRVMGGLDPEQFRLGWKLGFMIDNPLHFPSLVVAAFRDHSADLWMQLIGILGWLDVPLAWWAYPVLSLAFLVTILDAIELDAQTRLRIAGFSVLAIVAYVAAVFLILFITWTPVHVQYVWGVQGRYFVVVLPALAIAGAALVNRSLPQAAIAAVASAAAAVSGIASLEAIWRVNWS